jgi:hypothetical protein
MKSRTSALSCRVRPGLSEHGELILIADNQHQRRNEIVGHYRPDRNKEDGVIGGPPDAAWCLHSANTNRPQRHDAAG